MDCVFKVYNQGHACRFVSYHENLPHVFPADFGTEAIEVGPHTSKRGPCLVLFRGVGTTPTLLNAWLEKTLLKWAVARVLWLSSDECFQAGTQEELLAKVIQLAKDIGGLLRLQCEPRELETWLVAHLPQDILHPVDCTHVVHVLQWEGRYRFLSQPVGLLYKTSPTIPQRVEDRLSKAAGKLAEALEVAQFTPSSGVAIDLGAAPGGWTAYLAQRMQRVVAVDPAALDPRALQPNVTHLACLAQDALGTLRDLVGASAGAGGSGADLVCCDMNRYPKEVLPVLGEVLGLLRPGGLLVFTLKFCGHGRDKSDWGGEGGRLAEALGPLGLRDARLVWLLANTMSERTCIAIKAQ